MTLQVLWGHTVCLAFVLVLITCSQSRRAVTLLRCEMELSDKESLWLGSTCSSPRQQKLSDDANVCRGSSLELLLWVFLKVIWKQLDNFQSTFHKALRTLFSFLF